MIEIQLPVPELDIPLWQKDLKEGDSLWIIFGGVSGAYRIYLSKQAAEYAWNELPGYGYTIAKVKVDSLHKVPGDY